jgi:myosin heavy chain 9/10/11/14
LEEAEATRAELLHEKLQLENKLQNLNESDIVSYEPNPERHPGVLEKKIVDLKSELAERQDVAAAAIEKMRRAERIAAETQKEIAAERQSIVQLHKDKVTLIITSADGLALLEKSVNDLRMRLVDLETRSHKGGAGEGSFLAKRIQEVLQLLFHIAHGSWRGNCKIVRKRFPSSLGLIAT